MGPRLSVSTGKDVVVLVGPKLSFSTGKINEVCVLVGPRLSISTTDEQWYVESPLDLKHNLA